jgi:hypothetical protein
MKQNYPASAGNVVKTAFFAANHPATNGRRPRLAPAGNESIKL